MGEADDDDDDELRILNSEIFYKEVEVEVEINARRQESRR